MPTVNPSGGWHPGEIFSHRREQIPQLIPLIPLEVEHALDVTSRQDQCVTVRRGVHVGSGDRQIAADPDPIGGRIAERAVEIHCGLLEWVGL